MRWYLLSMVGLITTTVCLAQTTDDPSGMTPSTAKPRDPAKLRYPDKLLHQPTPMPDRIILTWKDDPATTQAVTWRTARTSNQAIAELAEVEDGPYFEYPAKGSKKADAGKIRRVTATTQTLESNLSEADYHTAEFTGLKSDTKYLYRVGMLAEKRAINWSEWFEFRTMSDQPAPLRFIYFGDAQNDVKSHWSRVIRGAYSDMPKAHFLLHAGDLINVANADAEWGEWHQAAGWINGQVPSIPTPGNHEYAAAPQPPSVYSGGIAGSLVPAKDPQARPKSVLSKHWRPQFALPEHGPPGLEETTYYLDINGVRIISLNSNEKHAEQVPWLEEVLKSNPHKWTVVTFHHPVYSSAAGRQKDEENKAVRQLWRPVFDKYGVDLVLQGHDHTYGRSGLMREDNLLTGTQMLTRRGTVYCVSVSGPKMYELGVQPWMVQKAENKQLYQLISIEGNKLHYEARTAKGELYDEFELRKRSDGGNTIVERSDLEYQRQAGPKEKSPTRTQLIVALIAMVALALGFGLWKVIRRGPDEPLTHTPPHA